MTVKCLLKWKTPFHMACKEGQFDVVLPIESFFINFNAQHVNGMTLFLFDFKSKIGKNTSTIIRYFREGRVHVH